MKHQQYKVNNESELQLYKAFSLIKTAAEAAQFLQDLCTPAEIQAMADRWLVIASIKDSKPYRQIYEETGVSVTTVGRVARCLSLGTGGYNLIYQRAEKQTNETTSKIKNRRSKEWKTE